MDWNAQANAFITRETPAPTATLPIWTPAVPTLFPTLAPAQDYLKQAPLPATSQYTEEEIQDAIRQGIITPTPEGN